MQDFRKLQVWQKGHQLVLAVYRDTRRFPKEEIFALTNQMRRSAISTCANIAEGCGRQTNSELSHFMHIAMGSACELEYHLLLARDLGMLAIDRYKQLATDLAEVKRMLTSLIQKVKAKN
ncbi:MAG TPA: four helix bundle protein [Phycisphaerae bacterium]|nr:four helix bundle protein [Phycisphaerae bacterium]HRR84863.1 four helix bundle protein [Phycisphaerae bacterium]